MINYVNNALDSQLKACDQKKFEEIITRTDVEQIIQLVRTGHPEKKRALPAFTLQGVLDECRREEHARRCAAAGKRLSTRCREWMVSNGLCMIDIDRKDGYGRDLWEGYKHAMEHHDVNYTAVTALAHVTPSGHGLRLVLPLPKGVTIEQLQAKIEQLMGVEVDKACKDVSRISFAFHQSDMLHYNAPLLFSTLPDPDDDEPCGLEGLFEDKAPLNPPEGGEVVSAAPSAAPSGHSSSPLGGTGGGASASYPTTYDGIPYTEIVAQLVTIAGGAPEHGARNKFIYDRARELAYICDRDPQWVAHVLPTFGEATEKARRTIQSACENVTNRSRLPQLLEEALQTARSNNAASLSNLPQEDLMPALPSQLPPLIDHLVSNVDDRYKPAVAMAVFPALMAHLGNVRFRYIDNKTHEASCLTICMAPQSSGKSCVCAPIEKIVSDLRAEDIENQKKDNDWREKCRSLGSNKEKPQRPAVWTNLPSPNTTPAAMLQMAMDARGRRMFTMMNELDMLGDLRLTPGKKDPSIPIRLAYDTDLIQANRVGANSVNGGAEFRWNFYASTTPEVGVKFFIPYLYNGALSRITMCTILTELGDDMPVFGDYNEAWTRRLQPWINALNEKRRQSLECWPDKGIVVRNELAEQCAADIEQEYKDKIVVSGDQQFAELAYRAELSAFLRAMTLCVAEGVQWSEEIEAFYRWSLKYDLWCKMRFFGDAMERNRETVTIVAGRPNSLLDQLQNTFTDCDLTALKRKRGSKTDVKTLLKRWRGRGLVNLTEDGSYIKTPKALMR